MIQSPHCRVRATTGETPDASGIPFAPSGAGVPMTTWLFVLVILGIVVTLTLWVVFVGASAA